LGSVQGHDKIPILPNRILGTPINSMPLLQENTRTISVGVHDRVQEEGNSNGSLSQKSRHVIQVFGGIVTSYLHAISVVYTKDD
jgi:hypothetical protein